MPYRTIHTVSTVTQTAAGAADTAPNVGTSPVKLFDGLTFKKGEVIHLVNTHASQDLYVKWYNRTEKKAAAGVIMTSTNYFIKIAAGQDRQFQFEDVSGLPDAGVEIWILGSGATTTYNAVKMKRL